MGAALYLSFLLLVFCLSRAARTNRPGDPAAIASAIRTIVHLAPAQRAEMGLAGRAYVEEHHAFSSLAAKFASTLDTVVAKHETLG